MTLAAADWQCLLNLSRLAPEFLHLRARRVLLIGGKPEVIFDSIDTVYQLGTNYKGRLHPKDSVAPEILIPIQEKMRHKRTTPRCTDHEVNMCWAEWVAPHRFEQLACRTVIGNGIAHWHDGSESKGARVVSAKTASQVPFRLIFILNIVQLVGRGLPDL
jgi:hypothetical protein